MTQKKLEHNSNIRPKIAIVAAVFILLIPNPADSADNNLSCRTLRSMARIYMAYGQYHRAQPVAERALRLAKQTKAEDTELALAMTDLATVYLNQGRLDEAQKLCSNGLGLQQKALYENHPYLAQTLRVLSSIYIKQGKLNEAQKALNRAVAIMLTSHHEDDRAMIPFQIDIAKLLCAQNKFEGAEACYQLAFERLKAVYGGDHLYTANVMADMARLYFYKKNYTKAEELIGLTLKVQKKLYGCEYHTMAHAWLIKAGICKAKGDSAGSAELIEKALSKVKESGNTRVYQMLQKQVERIRAEAESSYGPVAKAVQ